MSKPPMTLEQYRKNQAQYFPNSVGLYLAESAVVFYNQGLNLLGGNTPPFIPTRYNIFTGEQVIESKVATDRDIMDKTRQAEFDADQIYKNIMDYAKRSAIRGDFALAYILAGQLYRMEPQISDLPAFMEGCLRLLCPTGRKDILEAATSCVQYLPEDPVVSPMFRKGLSEFSKG